jgi:vacuolar-type H+-ATPase subunit E/Vma4
MPFLKEGDIVPENTKEEDPKSNFLSSIEKFAEIRRAKILEEIREVENIQIKKAESETINSARTLMQLELSEMKNRITTELSEKSFELRLWSARKKKELTRKFFNICEQKLKEFSSEPEYCEKLKKYSENIYKLLGKGAKVFIRPQDSKYSKVVSENFENCCEILHDKTIRLGGIRGENKNVIVDETYDTKLSQQRFEFAKNYGPKLIEDESYE